MKRFEVYGEETERTYEIIESKGNEILEDERIGIASYHDGMITAEVTAEDAEEAKRIASEVYGLENMKVWEIEDEEEEGWSPEAAFGIEEE